MLDEPQSRSGLLGPPPPLGHSRVAFDLSYHSLLPPVTGNSPLLLIDAFLPFVAFVAFQVPPKLDGVPW